MWWCSHTTIIIWDLQQSRYFQCIKGHKVTKSQTLSQISVKWRVPHCPSNLILLYCSYLGWLLLGHIRQSKWLQLHVAFELGCFGPEYCDRIVPAVQYMVYYRWPLLTPACCILALWSLSAETFIKLILSLCGLSLSHSIENVTNFYSWIQHVPNFRVWYFSLPRGDDLLQLHWIHLLNPLCHCFEAAFVFFTLELVAEGSLSLTCNTLKSSEYKINS